MIQNATAHTKSQYLLCFDRDGNNVLELHRFKNPDGTLAGSGKPDPKRISIKGITYGQPTNKDPKPKRLSNKQINAILDKKGLAALITYWRWFTLKRDHLIFIIRERWTRLRGIGE